MNFCYRRKTSQGVSLLLTKKKSKMLIKMTTEIALHFKTLYRQEIKHYIELSIFSAHKVENIIKFSLRRFFSSVQFSSVQFSCSVMSDSLRPHGLQHARAPCPLPTPGVYSNSCPLSR